MAVIDDYFRHLEERINNAKSKEEEEVLVKEARKLYFPPEGGIGTVNLKYKGELQRHYIDKRCFVDDLKDIGTSYRAVAKSTGLKTDHVRKFKGEDCVTLLDKDRKNIMELTGLDIMTYAKRTETAGRQPQRPINAALIEEGIEESKLTKYELSMGLYANSSALDNYIKKETMPLHRAKEICDILGLEHSEVIIKED